MYQPHTSAVPLATAWAFVSGRASSRTGAVCSACGSFAKARGGLVNVEADFLVELSRLELEDGIQHGEESVALLGVCMPVVGRDGQDGSEQIPWVVVAFG